MTLQYHKKPIVAWDRGRHSGVSTPYKWSRKAASGWRIGFGVSSFLVAEGAGVSICVGKKLFRQLEDEWAHRRKARLPKKTRKAF